MLAHPNMKTPVSQAGRAEVITFYVLKAVLVVGVIYAVILSDYFMIFTALVAVIGSICRNRG